MDLKTIQGVFLSTNFWLFGKASTLKWAVPISWGVKSRVRATFLYVFATKTKDTSGKLT